MKTMYFTKYHSLQDVLAYPQMRDYLKIFYSEDLLALYPESLHRRPLARLEQEAVTPWGEPFSILTDQLMDAVNLILDFRENHTRKAVALWEEEGEVLWDLQRNARGGKAGVCLIAPRMENLWIAEQDPIQTAPAVLICPGGGYEQVCFSGEGTPVLRFMEAHGYRGFLLKYRVGADGAWPAPQEDLARAICYLRRHAAEYRIDPHRIMVIGSSAGGHLCASEAALYREFEEASLKETGKTAGEASMGASSGAEKVSARPDQVVLCYPVISLEKEAHEGSARVLIGETYGKKEKADFQALRRELSVERLVTKDYPPTFVWACADDDCVLPSNAKRMGEALKKAGVSHKLRIYPGGGHGCGLAFSKSARDWSQEMLEFFQPGDS